MPWLRLDDSMGEHRKTRRLLRKSGLASFGLHALAMIHASRYLTDGFIESEYVEEVLDAANVRGKARTRAVQLLVDSGQWTVCDGGWQLHDYLDYNPTRSAVLESRRKDAERKARGRHSPVRPDSARTDAGVREESARPVPSRPDPTTPKPPQAGATADELDAARERLKALPPPKPTSGRKRDLDEYGSQLDTWVAAHFPGCEPSAIEGLIGWVRSRGTEPTPDALREFAEAAPNFQHVLEPAA